MSMSHKIRTFYLFRHNDVNGLSGTGVVAIGVAWPNGKCHIQWISFKPSIDAWDSVDAMIDIHGHQGETELIWGDPPSPDDKPKRSRKKKSDGQVKEETKKAGKEA